MSHEIETHDNVLLHREAAWHGLGIVVDEAPTPTHALELAGLGYGIEQRPLFCKDEAGKLIEVETHVANYRKDIGMLMGVVTASYVPVQNWQMAEFAEAIGDNAKDVKIESIGSIRDGRRVWMLLKGETFGIANGDEMFPYLCISNGHDGSAAFRVTPTTVRVVCSNTLHMVIPSRETGELLDSAISLKHTTNVLQRVEEAKLALKHYAARKAAFRETAEALAKVEVKQEDLERFFWDCYVTDFGEIPTSSKNRHEENRRNKAISAFASFSRRFDDERTIAGASAWNAFNAYSGLVQHDQKSRGKDDEARIQRRIESNLFGLSQQRTQAAFAKALTMVG